MGQVNSLSEIIKCGSYVRKDAVQEWHFGAAFAGQGQNGMRSDQACINVPEDKMYKIQLMSLLDTSNVLSFLYIFEIHDRVWNQGSSKDAHQKAHR